MTIVICFISDCPSSMEAGQKSEIDLTIVWDSSIDVSFILNTTGSTSKTTLQCKYIGDR